jgi:prepilin-type N-terminal cleavage/methylation domain-containing protein
MSDNRTFAVQKAGFTIVELLIVIVVIAVLATISVVAYSGIQARANDARMVSAVTQIEKALKLYSVDNGSVIRGGYGSTTASNGAACIDGNSGFFGTGAYTCTVEDTLVASKLLPQGFTSSLPPNLYFGTSTGGASVIMFYTCGTAGQYGLYWTLRNPSAADTTSLDSTLTSCGNSTMLRDSWGMRAGKMIQL